MEDSQHEEGGNDEVLPLELLDEEERDHEGWDTPTDFVHHHVFEVVDNLECLSHTPQPGQYGQSSPEYELQDEPYHEQDLRSSLELTSSYDLPNSLLLLRDYGLLELHLSYLCVSALLLPLNPIDVFINLCDLSLEEHIKGTLVDVDPQ